MGNQRDLNIQQRGLDKTGARLLCSRHDDKNKVSRTAIKGLETTYKQYNSTWKVPNLFGTGAFRTDPVRN